MIHNPRIDQVYSFMETQFAANMKPRPILERLWPSMVSLTDGADEHRPFGYSMPQYFSYDDVWSFFFCPEVVVSSTEHLTDQEFGDWLKYIRAHTNAHASLQTTDENTASEAVFNVMPEARDLVARVFEGMFV